MQVHIPRQTDSSGFTLVELLITILTVGILMSTAVVGISSLANDGRTSACEVSRDAVEAAYGVQQASTNGAPQTDLATLVSAGYLRLTGGSSVAGDVITGYGWTLTRAVGPPVTFVCT